MSSRLAKLRFVADGSLRGSNPEEQEQIKMIINQFAPYLFESLENIPATIIDDLGSRAEEMLSTVDHDIEHIISMYEPT